MYSSYKQNLKKYNKMELLSNLIRKLAVFVKQSVQINFDMLNKLNSNLWFKLRHNLSVITL